MYWPKIENADIEPFPTFADNKTILFVLGVSAVTVFVGNTVLLRTIRGSRDFIHGSKRDHQIPFYVIFGMIISMDIMNSFLILLTFLFHGSADCKRMDESPMLLRLTVPMILSRDYSRLWTLAFLSMERFQFFCGLYPLNEDHPLWEFVPWAFILGTGSALFSCTMFADETYDDVEHNGEDGAAAIVQSNYGYATFIAGRVVFRFVPVFAMVMVVYKTLNFLIGSNGRVYFRSSLNFRLMKVLICQAVPTLLYDVPDVLLNMYLFVYATFAYNSMSSSWICFNNEFLFIILSCVSSLVANFFLVPHLKESIYYSIKKAWRHWLKRHRKRRGFGAASLHSGSSKHRAKPHQHSRKPPPSVHSTERAETLTAQLSCDTPTFTSANSKSDLVKVDSDTRPPSSRFSSRVEREILARSRAAVRAKYLAVDDFMAGQIKSLFNLGKGAKPTPDKEKPNKDQKEA